MGGKGKHEFSETIWEWIARLSFLSGGTSPQLTMILKGPKFKTTPRQWRPFGACHPAIINECLKMLPICFFNRFQTKNVLSCLCCMAAFKLHTGFVAKLGNGRVFHLHLFFFWVRQLFIQVNKRWCIFEN